MASEKRWVLSKIDAMEGVALDLGGGTGELRRPLTRLGYRYVNVDLAPSGPDGVVADAHDLPFDSDYFDVVISSDSLEHFSSPVTVLREVRRVLRPEGKLVVWVPFLHPFHATDFYRYTPLGLRHLLTEAGLRVESIESPLGLFSVMAQAAVVLSKKGGFGRAESIVERSGAWLDARTRRLQRNGAFAAAYLVVATKGNARQRP